MLRDPNTWPVQVTVLYDPRDGRVNINAPFGNPDQVLVALVKAYSLVVTDQVKAQH